MFSALGAGERTYELGTQGGARGVDARLAEGRLEYISQKRSVGIQVSADQLRNQ